jgi:nicotinate-nucleotide adenylyltransferase
LPQLGILGGSFNPPHRGHLALARDAREELRLERVLLMPLHTPPHKPAAADPGPAHRLAMCRRAAEGEPGIETSALEIERGGPSYTVDTLGEIHADDPEAELTFVVGADTALTLPRWRRPEQVLALARLAVASRPGADGGEVLDALASIPAACGAAGPYVEPEVVFLSMAPIDVSSSQVRAAVARGEGVEELVGEPVARYIAEHGLYEAPA